jgi:hypothetical protein
VTVIVYVAPVAPDATVNDPDIDPPPAILQSGLEMILLGDDEIVQEPVSPRAKFEPETRTFVPGRPEVGSNAIEGSAVKVALAES